MSTAILGVAYALGSENLTHQELEQRLGAETMAKVLTGSGIRNRRVAPPEVCGSDLALDAAQKLFAEHSVDPSSIDLLVHCTQSPDYFMPSTACLLHEKLGLKKACAAFDVNLGCSQYVYALSIAHSMITAGVASRALVTTGDTVTHALHPKDRSVVPLMGDGGSATLVGRVPDGQGFLGFELGTDGTGSQYLIIPAGGARRPVCQQTAIETTDDEGNTRSPQNLYMNGPAIFHFAISTVPKTVQQLVTRLNLTVPDLDLVLFHQANQYMLDYLVKRLKIPPEKTHFHVAEVGNTSGTSMPVVLREAWCAGKIKAGSLVLMIVFGVGLSWAATVLRWPDGEALA